MFPFARLSPPLQQLHRRGGPLPFADLWHTLRDDVTDVAVVSVISAALTDLDSSMGREASSLGPDLPSATAA